MKPSRVVLSKSAIRANADSIRAHCGDSTELAAVVKADGYGLGAVALSRQLEDIGVTKFFCFDASQAAQLLPELRHESIVIILRTRTGLDPDEQFMGLVKEPRCHWTIHDRDDAVWLESIAREAGTELKIHLEVDTGMNRGGCDIEDLQATLEFIDHSTSLILHAISTHFASSDTDSKTTQTQARRLEAAIPAAFRHALIHTSNSHGLLHSELSNGRLIRIGIGLLGYLCPGTEELRNASPTLRPVLRWESQICQIRSVRRGEAIGYNATYVASSDMTTGIVPVGYGDGFPARTATNEHFEVGVDLGDGKVAQAPVVGRVNMDQLVIDLTKHANDVQVGREILVYSDDPTAPNSPQEVARRAGTLVYDILCRLDARLPRVWE